MCSGLWWLLPLLLVLRLDLFIFLIHHVILWFHAAHNSDDAKTSYREEETSEDEPDENCKEPTSLNLVAIGSLSLL